MSVLERKNKLIEDLKQSGKIWLDKGNYNLAFDCLTAYLKEVDNDIDAINWLGQVYKQRNEFKKAQECFTAVSLLNNNDEVALYGLADVFREQGNYDESLRLTKKILSLNERNPWAHYNYGLLLSLGGDCKGAGNEFMTALKIAPDNIYASVGLAEALAKQGKIEECVTIYKDILKNNKDIKENIENVFSYLLRNEKFIEAEQLMQKMYSCNFESSFLIKLLAGSYMQHGCFDKAAVLYERLLAIEPEDKVLLKQLADLYSRQQLFDKAVVLYERLLAIEPEDIIIKERLVFLYKENKKIDLAEKVCLNVLQLKGNNLTILEHLSSIYYERKEYEKARDMYIKILNYQPEDIKALVSLGHIYRYWEEYDNAAIYYEKAIKIGEAIKIDKNNKLCEAYDGLGRILTINNKFSEAEEKFEIALKYHPEEVVVLEGLAVLYKKCKRYEESKQLFTRCRQIDPLFATSYYGLGCVLLQERKIEEAIHEFKKALEICPSFSEARKELEWALREKKRYELAYAAEDSFTTREEIAEITKPRFCAIGIVHRCNFRCKICRIWEDESSNELSIEQWKSFFSSFKEVADDHCQINFAGGEPFLKKGITELIKFVVDQGFIAAVCTNAYLIDKDMAKKIGMSGLHTIALSLDSIDEERHDFIRGVKGSYSKVMNAIELLNKYAPRTELNLLTIILNLNLVDIIPLIKWVQENDKINMINF